MTLKQALWEIVRDESIIITNQNIDWLLDRANKKATGDAQALKESILERKGVIEENFPSALTNEEKVSEKEKQIEKMAKVIAKADDTCLMRTIAERLYKAGYRKQSEGEWISNRQTDEFICNLCGAIAPVDCEKERFYKSNFCPNCGSKMKGGE